MENEFSRREVEGFEILARADRPPHGEPSRWPMSQYHTYVQPKDDEPASVSRMHTVTMRDESINPQKKPWLSVSVHNWMTNNGRAALFNSVLCPAGPKHIFLALWVLAQAGYFAYSYWRLQTSPELSGIRDIARWALPVARGSANLITFNCAAILFTVCRSLISKLRKTAAKRVIPFDHHISLHVIIAWCIVFWSVVHCLAHYFIELFLAQALGASPESLALASGPGLSGQIIAVCLCLIVSSAVPSVRQKFYEVFWFTHHLYTIFFLAILVHGSFCFIKSDPAPGRDVCRGGPLFWKWWIGSAFVFVIERLAREVKGRERTTITRIIQHPSRTVEIRISKPSCKAEPGQYVFVCCPEISPFEWHPFTLTSSPHEEELSLHIRIVGDWTERFAERCGYTGDTYAPGRPSTLPFVMVDGPYGSASEDVFNYKVSVLVGGGIGVTPFASVLKTIWYRLSRPRGLQRLKKVHFIWSCRDYEAFEWFRDLLLVLERDLQRGERYRDFLTINTYLTKKLTIDNTHNIFLQEGEKDNQEDAITGLHARTNYGRPNFDAIFKCLRQTHPATDIGVFYCGPKPLGTVLQKACNRWTECQRGGTRFYYGQETIN
ncbi:MAG: hypothetical protein SGCHY_004269 [Lobulomycetales sp.]